MEEKKKQISLHSRLKMFEITEILKFQTTRFKLCTMALLNSAWHDLIMHKNYAWTQLPSLGSSWWRNKEKFIKFLHSLENFKYVSLPLLKVEMISQTIVTLFKDLVDIKHIHLQYQEQVISLKQNGKSLLPKIKTMHINQNDPELFSLTTNLVKLELDYSIIFPSYNNHLQISIPSLIDLTLYLETFTSYSINLENSEHLQSFHLKGQTYSQVTVTLVLTNPKLKRLSIFGKIEVTNLKDVLLQFKNLECFQMEKKSPTITHSYLQYATSTLKRLKISKILNFNFPFLSSLQYLQVTDQFFTQLVVQGLPSLIEFKIQFVQAEVSLSNLVSLNSIIFSENIIELEAGIDSLTKLILLPDLQFPLKSLLPLQKSIKRLKIELVSQPPQYIIEHFPLNEIIFLNLDSNSDMPTLSTTMRRLTKLSLVCADKQQFSKVISFPFLHSLHIYPHGESKWLNSFQISQDCLSLETVQIFGNCQITIFRPLDHILVRECTNCKIKFQAPVREITIQLSEQTPSLTSKVKIIASQVDSLVLQNVHGSPDLELTELRKLRVIDYYDENLIRSIIKRSPFMKLLKLEQIENVSELDLPKNNLEAVDSEETNFPFKVTCPTGIKLKERK